MWTIGTPPLELVIRTALVYLAFFGALRVFGKREIGQFTLFDLSLVLLAANALQPAITGPDASIPGGLIVILTLFALNRGIAALRVRSSLVRRILEFGPTVVGRDGSWFLPVLVRQGLDLLDVQAALREHGLDAVEQMKLATLEADGSISIVATDTPGSPSRAQQGGAEPDLAGRSDRAPGTAGWHGKAGRAPARGPGAGNRRLARSGDAGPVLVILSDSRGAAG